MIVTTYPKAYQSAFREALFVLGAVNGSNGVDISINTPLKPGQPLGVKRIYAQNEASVNVTPYVRGMIEVKPVCDKPHGLVVGTDRTIPCAISAAGLTSNTVILSGGVEDLPIDTILSAAPDTVRIAYGEKDEISVITSRVVDPVVASVYGGEEHFDYQTLSDVISSNMITAVVDPKALCGVFANALQVELDKITEFTIQLRLTGGTEPEKILSRRYIIDYYGVGGRRLAWVNRYGGVDYYTFPTVSKTRNTGSRTRMETTDGYKTRTTMASKHETLVSEPCDGVMVDWLAEIFSSPDVWLVKGSEYEKVEVSGGEVVSSPLQPTRVNVEIAKTGARYGTVRR